MSAQTTARATGRECYHCKQWVTPEQQKTHDCWTTTEDALTQHLPEDLMDAWQRIRETAIDFGEQRIYASHRSIMFSRKSCYFFVRPTPKRLELCFFLGRKLRHPAIKQTHQSSKVKTAHTVFVTHRDEVETPITDWLREAYSLQDQIPVLPKRAAKKKAPKNRQGKKKNASSPAAKSRRKSRSRR